MSSQDLEDLLIEINLKKTRERLEKAYYFPDFIERVMEVAEVLIENPEGLNFDGVWRSTHILPPVDIYPLSSRIRDCQAILNVLCRQGLARYNDGKYFFDYQPRNRPIKTAA